MLKPSSVCVHLSHSRPNRMSTISLRADTGRFQTQRDSSVRSSLQGFRFESLPSDVFDAISACLLGHELVHFSHVNRRIRVELLSNPRVWTSRLRSSSVDERANENATAAKRAYLSDTSFLFPGTGIDTSDANARGACVPVPTFFRREPRFRQSPRENSQLLNHPFTMDLWFSILPSDEQRYDGGVLVGAQSVPAQATDRWADNNQQFAYMDAQRTLYCSVLGHDEIIAERLESERWYHLALAFDGGEQTVYLDGVIRNQTQGSVHHEWTYLHYTQLGSGHVSGASVAKPTPDFGGWYAFRGLIDEFRLWKRALERCEVESLARGIAIKIRPVYSLRGASDLELCGAVQRVRCSRPLERWCVLRGGAN
jgi:hypothetical protein